MKLDPDAALAYLGFVAERHRIWERRQRGEAGPWTTDPVLLSHKFTNIFRVLDPGTQYVLTELPADNPRDTLMRCFLYRHTGRVEAWEYLAITTGLPKCESFDDTLAALKEYRGPGTVKMKQPRRDGQTGRGNRFRETKFKRTVFTNAYLVFPQSHIRGADKLETIVDLAARLFTPGAEQDVVPDFLAAPDQQSRFEVLRRNKGVGDFMSMQVLTDWGYLSGADEDEFVQLGPGARKGAQELLGTNPGKLNDVLEWAHESVHALYDCPALKVSETPVEWTARFPSLMDIQNTLCEFSKYARHASKPSREKTYAPAHPGPQSSPVLPDHWL